MDLIWFLDILYHQQINKVVIYLCGQEYHLHRLGTRVGQGCYPVGFPIKQVVDESICCLFLHTGNGLTDTI